MAKFLYRVGIAAARRAWLVVTAWVLVIGLSAAAMLGFAGIIHGAFITGKGPIGTLTSLDWHQKF